MSEDASPIWAIELSGLVKSFGSQPVLRGLELKVKQGDFLTIFGPNGAGKTTLLRILATFMRPNKGQCKIAGFELNKQAKEIRQNIGFVSHDTLLYEDLTGYENLKFYGRMYDVPHLEERIAEVIHQVGMEARLHHRIGTLSHGMRKRFAIARAVIHKPSIILLDEPETGLDQHALTMLTGILDSLGPRRTVLMTTHNMVQGLKLANQVGILVRGKLAFLGEKPTEDGAAFADIYQHFVEVHQ
ncbi:MAG: heme ABC exporter ATP-binding protein CcmA [Dehalococcoidia bacterium]|nr:heme ABC exporter ATP-binding protein CcmA [Dehalococcoidia bacterium]